MDKIVLWGIIAIATLVIGRQLYTHFYNSGQPQHSLKVAVTHRYTKEFMGRTSKEKTELPPPRVDYYVRFRPLAGGNEREFKVSEHLYEQLAEGASGTLVFQGNRFIAFEPDETILDND
ncbi:hypothetical protein AN401_18380 [Zobellella denitrificans]|uniref:DUF2500 domain-containing protein n=1 Tax=Zobellella denitrificans TaxID=347534 RepID=A0A291HTS3_9GAMM|nr:DUF2500 domain-containing protein [Zobellella denitrificans]ATG75573.1 hypothetical protein AN401_18380 [Zobellella denitrificans]